MDWLPDFPTNWALLVGIGVGWGLSGIPLTPFWAFLGFRCGWLQGFLVGWVAALTAMAIHFPLFRKLGNKLSASPWFTSRLGRHQAMLTPYQADATGLVWARMAWAIPFVLVNAWAAQGTLKLPVFLVLSSLSIAPNIAGVTLSGDVAAHWNDPESRGPELAMALGMFGLAGLVGWLFKRWRHARKGTQRLVIQNQDP